MYQVIHHSKPHIPH
ncbi:hypothetical protein ID866_12882 [Astraeus odoratus]|nr:hypothetical protein ID866_12882 [Astraeus odoratus]